MLNKAELFILPTLEKITESDWKRWKKIRLRAIDDFCAETFRQVQQLADSDDEIHERHRKLYRLVTDRDREICEVFDPLTRSRAILQIVNLYRVGLIAAHDMQQFSAELQAVCREFLARR